MEPEQAAVLIRQLGGQGRLVAMIGASHFIRNVEEDGTPSLSFKFKGSKVANYARIALDASDTYTIRLFKVRGYDAVLVRTISDLYADGLREAFERATGLYLSMGTMGRANPRKRPSAWGRSGPKLGSREFAMGHARAAIEAARRLAADPDAPLSAVAAAKQEARMWLEQIRYDRQAYGKYPPIPTPKANPRR